MSYLVEIRCTFFPWLFLDNFIESIFISKQKIYASKKKKYKKQKNKTKNNEKLRNQSLSSYLEEYEFKKFFSRNIFSNALMNSSISIIHWKEEPLGKIKSQGRPETSPKKLPGNFRTSPCGPKCNTKGTSTAWRPWDALWTSF